MCVVSILFLLCNMVSDASDLLNPFAQAPGSASASAMDENPVLSPRSSVDGAAGTLDASAGVLDVAPLQQAASVTPPAV